MREINKDPNSLPVVYGFVMMKTPTEIRQVIISVKESNVFEDYLNSANNNDADIHIAKESIKEQYQLVYGSIIYNADEELDKEYIESGVDKSLITLDVPKYGELDKSYYAGIKMYDNQITIGEYAKAVPFVALMQTTCKQDINPITMFHVLKDAKVWESMVNRRFLFACKKFVKIDGLTKENWKEHIDKNILIEAYALSTMYFE